MIASSYLLFTGHQAMSGTWQKRKGNVGVYEIRFRIYTPTKYKVKSETVVVRYWSGYCMFYIHDAILDNKSLL